MRIDYVRFDRDLPATYRPFTTDAGTDVLTVSETAIAPFQTVRLPLNLAVALPEGHYAMLAGRSSVAARGLLVHVGTVDQGYRGQLYVAVSNITAEPQVVGRGERIAQLIVLPFVSPQFVEVDALPATERAGRGWGSSGR
ncbi:MAG: dUTP diphosphatase [Chloroflexi bacterium]|nr:dUTP diphosphatase [Chloroflexota bacterium]MCL5110654.1 dUTP diphosphatase [Chloroflexota bacterium]